VSRPGSARPGAPVVVALAVILVLAVGAAILVSNPRHRAFYFGVALPPAGPAAHDAPRAAGRPADGAPGAPSTVGRVATGAGSGKRYVPRPDGAGRIRIPVADEVPWRLPFEGVPPGWELHEFAGRADVEVVRVDGRIAARLRADQGSFALYRDALVDLAEFPVLSWSWKVLRLPAGGDVRGTATDDQAAQVYVIFPRWPAPRATSDVVGYVWDTRAPVGTRLKSPKADNVRVIVVESGTARLDTWQTYQRDVAADYAQLFGRRPPRVGMVAVMIDSDDTRGRAEALLGDLVFSRRPGGTTEIPNVYAKMSRMMAPDRVLRSMPR
jgi:hypothetical protein